MALQVCSKFMTSAETSPATEARVDYADDPWHDANLDEVERYLQEIFKKN